MPDFDLKKKLGNGAFGEVWLGDDRALGVERAIKFVPPHKINDPTNFYEEPQTLMTLKHPNVIEVTDAGKTAKGQLYIAMEYYPQGSISDLTKGAILELTESIKIIGDAARGVEYAHAQDIIHRDIKPANIIIDNQSRGRLSDFGLATRVDIDGNASPYGYLGHLAPEVINEGITDKRTDVYALGVTFYRLINGDAYLPMTIDPDDLIELIKEGEFPNRRDYRPFVPTQLRTITNRALDVNPNERYQSAAEFRHALEKIKIHANWLPTTIPNGTIWNCKVNHMFYKAISIKQSRGCYDFQLYKGSDLNKLKNITSDTLSCELKNNHEKHIKKVLSRIVIKGK